MKVVDLPLSGLKLITPQIFYDERGFFVETYSRSLYLAHGIEGDFVQDNHSYSKQNVLRGMHFQAKPGQAKLVSVDQGAIFDVVVDIRPSSPTFSRWIGVHLNSEKGEQLFIPVGFAHGFCVLSESAHVHYKVTHQYDPTEEKSFFYNDPDIGIDWPIDSPILSLKDREAPLLKELV